VSEVPDSGGIPDLVAQALEWVTTLGRMKEGSVSFRYSGQVREFQVIDFTGALSSIAERK